jgi:hypothetical protein
MNSRKFQCEKTKIPLKFVKFTKTTLGFLAKLLKYPWNFGQITKIPLEFGMGFSWAFLGFSDFGLFLGFSDFGLLIIN